MTIMLRCAVFAVLVSVAACTSPRPAQHSPDTASLEREIPRLLRVSGIPGLSMAVVQNGRVVWAGAFGTLNDSAQTPLNPGTIFEAASLSKPVFAYLVLRLADRGEFDLDRPLYEMLEYPRLAHDERYKRITARIVLSHGTGLPNWGG
ncbi:MAG TPA: serine hydrolase domain-containing protein, partial [Steroidobacteraceae bacterium]|nr:serine hydrolase domain-containing protein [Steroidobacteraceae bacterium]